MERQKAKSPEEASRNDIFSVLLNAVDPYTDQRIPMPELWMESNTLIVAGKFMLVAKRPSRMLPFNARWSYSTCSMVHRAFETRPRNVIHALLESPLWLRYALRYLLTV